MNAVLQCFASIPQLAQYSISPPKLDARYADVHKELLKVMIQLTLDSKRIKPVAPLQFREAVSKTFPALIPRFQHDAHEFLTLLCYATDASKKVCSK